MDSAGSGSQQDDGYEGGSGHTGYNAERTSERLTMYVLRKSNRNFISFLLAVL